MATIPYAAHYMSQDSPDYIIAICGPPASGKSTLGEVMVDSRSPVQPYKYYHVDVYSDTFWDRLYPTPEPNDGVGQFVGKVGDALADVVGEDRDPASYKQVVLLENFPRDTADAQECRYPLASALSANREFPDMVISLRCAKQVARERYFARTPEFEGMELWFEMLYAKYWARTVPLLESYRQRGIHIAEVDTNGDEVDIEGEWEEMMDAIDEFLDTREAAAQE